MHYNREDWFGNAMLADNINVMHAFPDFMVFTFATLVMSNVEIYLLFRLCNYQERMPLTLMRVV